MIVASTSSSLPPLSFIAATIEHCRRHRMPPPTTAVKCCLYCPPLAINRHCLPSTTTTASVAHQLCPCCLATASQLSIPMSIGVEKMSCRRGGVAVLWETQWVCLMASLMGGFLGFWCVFVGTIPYSTLESTIPTSVLCFSWDSKLLKYRRQIYYVDS